MMIADIFLSERDEIKLNWCCSIINTFIYISYCVAILIAKYKFDFNAYVIMESLNIWGILYAILVGYIFIYNAISNKINRKSFKVFEIREDEKLIVGDNEENECLTP